MYKKYQAVLKIITIFVIVIILLKLCLVFLWPFVVSVILVLFMEPLVSAFNRIGLTRKMSVIAGFVILIAFIFSSGYFISNYIFNQVNFFINKLPEILAVLSDRFKFLNIEKINYYEMIKALENLIPSYREKIIYTVISTVNGLVYAIIISITTIFISLDLKKTAVLLKSYLPEDVYTIIHSVVKKNMAILKVEFKLVIVSTLQTVLGLYILGIPSPLTIGIICGILDLLPVIGPSLIFFPMIIYQFAKNNIFTAIGLIMLYILLAISREIMEIRFMGSNLHIHPVITIFSLYVGVIIYGGWGVIIGPFTVILMIEVFNKYFTRGRGFLY